MIFEAESVEVAVTKFIRYGKIPLSLAQEVELLHRYEEVQTESIDYISTNKFVVRTLAFGSFFTEIFTGNGHTYVKVERIYS